MSPLYRRFTILLIALALALGLMTLAAGATPPADPPSPPADGLAASAGDEPPAIRLLAGTFRPAGGDPAPVAALAGIDALGEAARTGDGRLLYLVQFDGPILAEWRAALEGAGAEIRDYIPDFAYKVAIADEDVAALSALPGVIWQGPFASGYGVSPEVASSVASAPQAARAELDEPPSDAFIANLAGAGPALHRR